MQDILRSYISFYSADDLFNTEQLLSFLINKNVDLCTSYQIVMLLKLGNVREYYVHCEKTMSSVEINNILMCCESKTGLKREIIKKHLYSILMALGVDCAYEKFFSPSDTDKSLFALRGDVENSAVIEMAFCSSKEISKGLKYAQELLDSGNYDVAINIYIRLAKCGSVKAMYILGKAYFEGIYGTAKSEKKGLMWLKLAAENGHPQARVMLGDYYYENKKQYNKAYEMYSGAGTLSVDDNVKDKIADILNKRQTNFSFLFFGAVLILAMWIFLFAVESSCVALGVILTIASTVFYVFMGYKQIRYSSNVTQTAVLFALMLLVWFVYPFVILL